MLSAYKSHNTEVLMSMISLALANRYFLTLVEIKALVNLPHQIFDEFHKNSAIP
jgi:hypothetical protein